MRKVRYYTAKQGSLSNQSKIFLSQQPKVFTESSRAANENHIYRIFSPIEHIRLCISQKKEGTFALKPLKSLVIFIHNSLWIILYFSRLWGTISWVEYYIMEPLASLPKILDSASELGLSPRKPSLNQQQRCYDYFLARVFG